MKNTIKVVIILSAAFIIGGGYLSFKGKITKSTLAISQNKPFIEIRDIVVPKQEDIYFDQQIDIVDLEKISYFKLSIYGKDIVEILANENLDNNVGLDKLVMKQPYKSDKYVDNIEFYALVQQINLFKKEKLIETNATDLNKYGLKTPSIVVTVKDDKETMELEFGKQEGNMIYFKEQDNMNVYMMRKDIVQPFKKLDAFSLISRGVYIHNMDNIAEIIIESPIGTDIVTVENIEVQEDEAISSKREVTLNNQQLTLGQFNNIYQQLLAILIDAPLKRESLENREAEVKITYKFNGKDDVVMEYIPYDSDFYFLRMDGYTEFAVTKKDVTSIMHCINEIKKELNDSNTSNEI